MTIDSLAQLPRDILALILGDSPCSIRLWKCGNNLLNTKLSSTLKHLTLRHTVILNAQCPRMLSALSHLRSLSIFSHEALLNNPMDWATLRETLPGTLETINIDAKESPYFLLDFAPQWSVLNMSYLETDRYGRGKSRFADLGSKYPNLTDLAVISKVSRRGQSPFFNSDFAGLPPSLTRFKTDFISLKRGDAIIMRYLPPALTELDTLLSLSAHDSQDILECCPPALTSITKFDLWGVPAVLPKNLVKGTILWPMMPPANLPKGLETYLMKIKSAPLYTGAVLLMIGPPIFLHALSHFKWTLLTLIAISSFTTTYSSFLGL